MKYIALIGLLGLASCSREADEPQKIAFVTDTPCCAVIPPPTPLVSEVIVFAGQSNMLAGTGLSDKFVETARGQGYSVTPIECAVGGTKIELWQKGQLLYENCMAQMRLHPPKVILFGQGEANMDASAPNWTALFTAMVRDMRLDLGYEVPVLYTRCSSYNLVSLPVEAAIIRDQQTNLVYAKCRMFDLDWANGYIWVGHEPHYTRTGYEAVGAKMALVYHEGTL